MIAIDTGYQPGIRNLEFILFFRNRYFEVNWKSKLLHPLFEVELLSFLGLNRLQNKRLPVTNQPVAWRDKLLTRNAFKRRYDIPDHYTIESK